MLMMFSIFIPFIIATIGASFWWIFTFILLMPYVIIKAWNNYSNVAPFIAILTSPELIDTNVYFTGIPSPAAAGPWPYSPSSARPPVAPPRRRSCAFARGS